MGAPKQKWTGEEEAALRAGVDKYGVGKWRAIQKDPKFGPLLTQRSNVDLKDKWRNMSVAAGGSPLMIRDKAASASRKEPKQEAEETQHKDQFEDIILEAVAALKEKDGSSLQTIVKYIEDNNQSPPPNFKRVLSSRLKALAVEGKLAKVGKQSYKLGDGALTGATRRRRGGEGAEDRPKEESKLAVASRARRNEPAGKKLRTDPDLSKSKTKTAEEAARAAAQAVAEAEAAAAAAEQAAREAEAAEAEAEAAEAAAEAAAAALRPPKKRDAAGKHKQAAKKS